MARAPLQQKIHCVLAGAEPTAGGVRVRFTALGAQADEVEDLIVLGPRGSLESVRGVGRLLRILRASRVRAPRDPYGLHDKPTLAAELLMRCRGKHMTLTVARRFDRKLRVWTESGVRHIGDVLDLRENAAGLTVQRRAGHSPLHIPRHDLIRYQTSTSHRFEVISVEPRADRALR